MIRLRIELDVTTFGDETRDQVADALLRTSTHDPLDEVEGAIWGELHERGIDSIVTVEGYYVEDVAS